MNGLRFEFAEFTGGKLSLHPAVVSIAFPMMPDQSHMPLLIYSIDWDS